MVHEHCSKLASRPAERERTAFLAAMNTSQFVAMHRCAREKREKWVCSFRCCCVYVLMKYMYMPVTMVDLRSGKLFLIT